MDILTITINDEKAVELDGDENIFITIQKDELDSAKHLCESALDSINKRLNAAP